MTHTIAVRRDGHVAELEFSNTPHNHANVDLLSGIADALDMLDGEADCRAVVLVSAGRPFCAGADLATREGGGIGGKGADPMWAFYEQALRLFATQTPIIAAVQGAAVGAGLGMAVAADFRVAAPEARFVANFTKLGYHPGFGLSHTLPRLIGTQRAALMFMTADRFKAADVLPWGLVDRIAPAADLRAAAHALAQEIAVNAPLALRATRQTLRAGLHQAVRAALVREHAEQGLLGKTADFAEGVRAVNERRAGRFVGK